MNSGLVVALILFGTAAGQASGPGPAYFIAVQNGAYNFKGGEAQLEESYKALQGMVKLADGQNVRLTLLFSAQYAVYIATDPVRLAEFEGWKKAGHEIGAYHQGPETRAWDGYSDLPAEALARLRKEEGAKEAVPGHKEYLEALGRLESGIKSSCATGGADKEFLAAMPEYELCGGPVKKGKSRAGSGGVNEFVAVSGGGDKVKKRLLPFHPADKAGIEAAKETFSGLSSGLYGTSFKSSPSEFGAFYSWLAFLRGKDPQGLRSRTVSVVVGGKLLPEKKAAAGAEPEKTVKTVKVEKPDIQPPPEARKPELPRLRPMPSLSAKPAGRIIFVRPRTGRTLPQNVRCGDSICDAFERALPGRCPRDCGN